MQKGPSPHLLGVSVVKVEVGEESGRAGHFRVTALLVGAGDHVEVPPKVFARFFEEERHLLQVLRLCVEPKEEDHTGRQTGL
jgi:hypothetical protein